MSFFSLLDVTSISLTSCIVLGSGCTLIELSLLELGNIQDKGFSKIKICDGGFSGSLYVAFGLVLDCDLMELSLLESIRRSDERFGGVSFSFSCLDKAFG